MSLCEKKKDHLVLMVLDILEGAFSEPIENIMQIEAPKVYVCGECAQSFDSQELVDCHMRSSHSNNLREVADAINDEELLIERHDEIDLMQSKNENLMKKNVAL